MNILDKIVVNKKREVALAKKQRPLSLLKKQIQTAAGQYRKLEKTGQLQLIAEIKQKSPSAGVIRKSIDVQKLARLFQKKGAAAISVLTDKKYFGGSLKNLALAKNTVKLPILRKDFICDEYQLYEAKVAGADIVLLIAGILKNRMRDFVAKSLALELQPLIEVHNKMELKKVLDSVAPSSEIIIGINNRDLKTFKVDLETSVKLVKMIPKEFVKISESGVTSVNQLQQLDAAGFDGVLISEGLKNNQQLFNFFKNMENNSKAYFGQFGGQFVPETLMSALEELEVEYKKFQTDLQAQKELKNLLCDFVGRPTALYLAENLTKKIGGAKIYLKREDLAHTGAHKINNALGQALLAKFMGKTRIIAETGAGQHGVATAAAAAKVGLECEVYMGEVDIERQQPNVLRMKLLGAKVVPVKAGSRTLKDAINEAIRDWVANVKTTHYLLGSVLGPHPYPTIVRNFQRVIGQETHNQIFSMVGRLPEYLIACVGGGSNSIGLFYDFLKYPKVKMVGVEAGGLGIKSGKHAARFFGGSLGILHGTKSFVLQNQDGQILETHSISAGLDYPSVGPEHSFLRMKNRVNYVYATDREALEAFHLLSRTEGILPALESAHAVAYAVKLAKKLSKEKIIIVNLSGRGDKDLSIVKSVK